MWWCRAASCAVGAVREKRDRPPLPRTVGWLVNAELSTRRCNNGAFSSGIGNELEIRI